MTLPVGASRSLHAMVLPTAHLTAHGGRIFNRYPANVSDPFFHKNYVPAEKTANARATNRNR